MDDYKEQFRELEPLHEKHREMLAYIDEFCRSHHIRWCLAYGSALGARRHGGPIPWDDDVDILMPAEDYVSFRDAFWAEGDQERFYLQEEIQADDLAGAPKLRMNGTSFIEPSKRHLDMHHGLFVDIFLVHHAPRSRWGQLWGRLGGAYLDVKRMSNQGYNKRRAFVPLMAFLRLFPRDFALRPILRWQRRQDEKDTGLAAVWGLDSCVCPQEWIFPAAQLDYDGLTLCVPRETDAYLERNYGNWQQVPNIDKIVWAQHASEWSVTEDFREKLPYIRDFADEMGTRRVKK